MEKNAKFSDCGKYRFWLSRTWDDSLPKLQLIGLNPSTANAIDDDATIESIIRIAKSNWYGGIVMTNLFAYIATKPEDLIIDPEFQSKNNFVLKAVKIDCDDVCFCWGAFKVAKQRALEVIAMFEDPICFAKNKDGSPRHPLYLKSDHKFIKF